MIVLLTFKMIAILKIENNLIINLVVYIGTIGLTILTSYLSYTYFEKFFLKLKVKFE